MPAVASAAIEQIDPSRLFRENLQPASFAPAAGTLPSVSPGQGTNSAQVYQQGINNQAAILQTGSGNMAAVWQKGQGNSAIVIQRH
jgi:hypothetical protein